MIGILIDAGVDINVQATDVSIIVDIIGVLIDAGIDINVQATEVSMIVEIIEVFLLVLTSMYRLQK